MPPVPSTRPLVLHAEDDDDTREVLADFLRDEGLRVVGANDGARAVECALELLPDLVLMDLGLPVMDGFEAVRRLRSHPRTRHIPIILLSGLASRAHLRHVATCGADAFLVKPTFADDLRRVIVDLLRDHFSPVLEDRRG